MAVFHTRVAAETVSLGRRLSSGLEPGTVIAFYGDLGSGKTTMIKGVCAGLGVTEVVKSPSFVIVTEYQGRLPVHHIDLYRIGSAAELESLAIEDYFEGTGVCLVEWAEKAEALLPQHAIRVRLELEGAGRRVVVEGLGSVSD